MTNLNDMPNAVTDDLDNPARRDFMAKSAAISGGLVIGVTLSGCATTDDSNMASTEINEWVAIKPNDTVVVRIARSEMGQGTLTGLAQLVAEELDCDWNKVTTEHINPGQSLARKRIWGDMSPPAAAAVSVRHTTMCAALVRLRA